ncbi:hypothetical protein [Cellvibrio mixtus]|uniref:hypothetical protein n=1 Tax=Cellvibrio mixtus TaxID=39650 RepID=UPI0005865EEA|nr:hypothetical protein [Cellvibrio mixtus]
MSLPDPIKKQGIKRLVPGVDPLDFSSLRTQGIEHVQQLAGDIWTDYNLHDPGVTILEQLCYGLTELAYQAKQPIADYLANERGQIDFHHHALYKPQEIFPTRPVTAEDYCKRILDEVPEIDAIRVTTVDEPGNYGACLYDVSLKLLQPLIGPEYTDEYRAAVRKKVLRVYQKNRNLGEDIHRIRIERSSACFLKGVIETTGIRPSADIYADVFFQVARKISSNVAIERYETLALQESLDTIFTGPLTRHGYIASEGLNETNPGKALDELNAIVSAIDGVKKVYHLELVNADGQTLDGDALMEQSFFLKFPEEIAQQTWLKIDFNPGKTTDAKDVVKGRDEILEHLMGETRRALQKLEFEYRAFRNNKTDTAQFVVLPQGKKKQFLGYYSIQHHFPNVYGINADGIPASETRERKIAAQQLKSYLYPFEQLLANMLALLQHWQQLFSLGEVPNHSYFAQFLDNQSIPDFTALYKSADTNLDTITALQAQYDPAFDRKSRALDTLLALYGEEFSQEGLLHFNYYHQEQPEYWAIDNKIRMLLHLADISQNRNGAFDTGEQHWQSANISSLHKKINILLGIQQLDTLVTLGESFKAHNVQLVSDNVLCKQGEPPAIASARAVPQLTREEQQKIRRWADNKNIRNNAENSSAGKALSLSPAMIRDGTNINAYYLQEQDKSTSVYFYSRIKKLWTPLKEFPEREQAKAYVHKFKKIITDLNSNSEGFYLLEHLLLRPRTPPKDERVENYIRSSDAFYHCRLSFIFPKWTARFANPAFRQFAEKTIANNLAAHLFPHIYWLTPEQMQEFESHYQPWLRALQSYEQDHANSDQPAASCAPLDQAAIHLRHWLEQNQPSVSYWI